jgi:hypothetical protein
MRHIAADLPINAADLPINAADLKRSAAHCGIFVVPKAQEQPCSSGPIHFAVNNLPEITTSLDDKVLDCLRTHIREEKTPINIAELCESLTHLLRYVEGYYQDKEDDAEFTGATSEELVFFQLQQVQAKTIMKDVDKIRMLDEKFRK